MLVYLIVCTVRSLRKTVTINKVLSYVILSCNTVSIRQKSVSWMNGGWSTSGVASMDSRLATWLLTTSLEDFGRASIRKEDKSNTTCELTILILSVSISFSVTFVWLLLCYIFHSKSVTTMLTIRPTRVFVLQGSAAAKSGYSDRLYSTLRYRYLLSDMPKKLLKSDNNCQSYSKCYRCTLFDLQFHVQDALRAFISHGSMLPVFLGPFHIQIWGSPIYTLARHCYSLLLSLLLVITIS